MEETVEGAPVLPVDCAGSLHTSVVEYLVRSGAGGVLIVACPPRDCQNREGPKWLEQRLYHEREAELKDRGGRPRAGAPGLRRSRGDGHGGRRAGADAARRRGAGVGAAGNGHRARRRVRPGGGAAVSGVRRWMGGGALALGMTLAMGWLSQVPYDAAGDAESMVRLAWR